jgi:hypothetical protein
MPGHLLTGGARARLGYRQKSTHPPTTPRPAPPHRLARATPHRAADATGREVYAEAGYMLPDLPHLPATQQTDQRPEHWLSPSLTERSTTEGTQDQNVHSLSCSPPRSASRYTGATHARPADPTGRRAMKSTRFLRSFFPVAFRCPVPEHARACAAPKTYCGHGGQRQVRANSPCPVVPWFSERIMVPAAGLEPATL